MKECQDYPLGAYSYDVMTGIRPLVDAFVKLLNATFLKASCL